MAEGSGSELVFDNARGDIDPRSPTAMLQGYLQSRGLPFTSDNMRRVLDANARQPGVIPGLENQAPPSADPGVGQQGNVAGKVEKAPTNQGKVTFEPPDYVPPPTDTSKSSAPPNQSTSDTGPTVNLGNLGAMIATGAGTGALYNYMGARRGVPGADLPVTMNAPAASVNTGDLTTPEGIASANNAPDTTSPRPAQTGDRFGTSAASTSAGNPAQDPMLQAALDRAVGPRTMIGSTSPTGYPTPTITPQEASGRIIQLPPGVIKNPAAEPGVGRVQAFTPRPSEVPTVTVRPPRVYPRWTIRE